MNGARVHPEFEIEQPEPSLLILRFGNRELSPGDQERIDQLAASVASGANLIAIAAPGTQKLPAWAERLLGFPAKFERERSQDPVSAGPPDLPDSLQLAPADNPISLSSAGVLPVFCFGGHETPKRQAGFALAGPPKGRGQVLLTAAENQLSENLVACLADRKCARQLEAALEQAFASEVTRWPRDDLFDRVTKAAMPALLVLDARSEARLSYRIDGGGELCTAVAQNREHSAFVDCGRAYRGGESLTLDLAADGIGSRQLLLLRRTAPLDFGKVLRVTLDDEDLGPWHLGNNAEPDCWAYDTFRISPELFLDSNRIVLQLLNESGAAIHSFRYHFFWEEDPKGLWLTELDPDRVTGARPRFDQDSHGHPIVVDSTLFSRGLGAGGATAVTFQIPAGYEWFETFVGLEDQIGMSAEFVFRLLIDDQQVFVSRKMQRGDPLQPARARFPGACRLTLVAEQEPQKLGGQPLFANPVLVRGD